MFSNSHHGSNGPRVQSPYRGQHQNIAHQVCVNIKKKINILEASLPKCKLSSDTCRLWFQMSIVSYDDDFIQQLLHKIAI